MLLKISKKKREGQNHYSNNSINQFKFSHASISKKKNLSFIEKVNLEILLFLWKVYLLQINNISYSKQLYKKILKNYNLSFRLLLKDYEFKIYRKDEIPSELLENCDFQEDWYYGYRNKTHYLLNGFNEVVGCLNLIFLSIYHDKPIFYLDTVEIRKDYRRMGLGSKIIEFIIEEEIKKYINIYIFLLVVNCKQDKLRFFSKLGFIPVKLMKTKMGTHCIMSYPFDENSEIFCSRMFEYFNWREEKKEFISSDCKYAYNPNPTGLYWCAKKNIYVTGLEKQSCKLYQKEKKIFNEKKFLDFIRTL
ncbi:MAG: GNAT family N-acetyltransferase [Promethearchaeota archaeon]